MMDNFGYDFDTFCVTKYRQLTNARKKNNSNETQ